MPETRSDWEARSSGSPSEKPWLIVTDLDGTLLGRQGELSGYTTTVLRRLRDKGNVIALASGRQWDRITPIRDVLGIGCPIIACNGATVGKETAGEFFESGLDSESVSQIIHLLRNQSVRVYVNTSSGLVQFETHASSGDTAFDNVPTVRDLAVLASVTVYKFSLVAGNEMDTRTLAYSLSTALEGKVQVSLADETTVDVNAVHVSKATGIKVLRDFYKIGSGRTIAFGNQGNDEQMVREADIGVAVGDATETLKRVADQVTQNSAQDGVARWLESFFG